MNLKKFLTTFLVFQLTLFAAWADKGMWLLNELKQQDINRMRELGFTMPIDKLYSLNTPSLSNAVVIFGRGCTGITVSDKGLVFTNHHCGYGSIQSQSSVEHDYLKDGFRSQSFQEELPIPGLTVKYLKNIVDVTDRINKETAQMTDDFEILKKTMEVSEKIAQEYETDKFTSAEVVPFYAGNKYYVVVYNVFKDVRMVFAPPSSVGKFGGDTDNWMYPRHTGDFSVFRVYADTNNKPAEYNKNNKPYKPVYSAKVSLNGYKEGDFSMTIGFPGSTERYLTSWGVQSVMEDENTPRIEVRGLKLNVWKKQMLANRTIGIQYASKYAGSSNYWKNAIGMNRGIKRLKVVERKQQEEKDFINWYTKNNLQGKYANILKDLESDYAIMKVPQTENQYILEALLGGSEVFVMAYRIKSIASASMSLDEKRKALEDLYKDYSPELDKQLLPAMLKVVREHGGGKHLPSLYKEIDRRYKGNYEKYAEYLFKESFIPYKEKVEKVLAMSESKQTKEFEKDPSYKLFNEIRAYQNDFYTQYRPTLLRIDRNKKELFAAQQKMDPSKSMPSDANFTMRMSYGKVGGYQPQDGAYYNYYTTEEGVFEKADPNNPEFNIQPEIINLLRKKDFGQYGVGDHLRLCFLSDNDITGGNSGSPVFDKNGDLIGLAFDGNWEAMSGDIEFEPNLQRTICVDIRYVLFMIDKWGGCKRLIDELSFVEKNPDALRAQLQDGIFSSNKMTCGKKGNCSHNMNKANCGKKGNCSHDMNKANCGKKGNCSHNMNKANCGKKGNCSHDMNKANCGKKDACSHNKGTVTCDKKSNYSKK